MCVKCISMTTIRTVYIYYKDYILFDLVCFIFLFQISHIILHSLVGLVIS